jgi:hypothetical protein
VVSGLGSAESDALCKSPICASEQIQAGLGHVFRSSSVSVKIGKPRHFPFVTILPILRLLWPLFSRRFSLGWPTGLTVVGKIVRASVTAGCVGARSMPLLPGLMLANRRSGPPAA